MTRLEELTAPCGLDCFNCPLYEENLTDDSKKQFAVLLKLEPEQVQCKGCRAQKGCRLHFSECATLDCVNAKGINYCFECDEFPCVKLQPAAEGADKYPHNMKMYNLCRMKVVGVESWAQNESKEIRTRYYQGKFVPGLGPTL
jgi:hypothetical protein